METCLRFSVMWTFYLNTLENITFRESINKILTKKEWLKRNHHAKSKITNKIDLHELDLQFDLNNTLFGNGLRRYENYKFEI